jgi:hypothetical protein
LVFTDSPNRKKKTCGFLCASGNEAPAARVYTVDGTQDASTSHVFSVSTQSRIMKIIRTHWLALVCVALFAYACDMINKDLVPDPAAASAIKGTVLYTTPKNGLVMDLLSMDKYKNATGFRIAAQPNNGEVRFLQNATLLYTPDTTKNVTSDQFLLRISTGDSATNAPKIDTVVIRFVPRDSIPCQSGVVADGFSTPVGKTLVMNVLANDRFCNSTVDSASLTVKVQPQHGSLSIRQDKRIVYTPNANYVGSDFFVYKVCSTGGQTCGEAPVRIAVREPDSTNCPGAMPDFYQLVPDSTLSYWIGVLQNDRFCADSVDYNSLTIVRPPRNGQATVAGSGRNRYVSYKTSGGFASTDSFRYRVCTTSGKCAEAEVSITIKGGTCTNTLVNDTLVYRVASTADTLYTKGTSIHILDNDNIGCSIDGIYQITVSSQPTHGTATLFGGTLIYKPKAGYKGPDRLEYGICTVGNSQSCTQKAIVYIDIR